MRTLAIVNQKGGVGKTTIAINLSAALAREGHRVLVVDMDPQGHCAVGTAVPEEQIEQGVYECLAAESAEAGEAKPTLESIAWQITPNLFLAPSRTHLADLEKSGAADRSGCHLLARALDRVDSLYDFAVVDCPPHLGALMYNALHAADEVVIPVETGYFSLQGLTKQLETVEAIRRKRTAAMTVRIVANQYDVRTKLAREILCELKQEFKDLVLGTVINFNTKLKEGASFGQPITEFAPESMGARDFQSLARELAGRRQVVLTETVSQFADRIGQAGDRLLASRTPLVPSAASIVEPSKPAAGPAPGHVEPVRPAELPSHAQATRIPMSGTPVSTGSAGQPVGDRTVQAAGSDADRAHRRIEAALSDIYGPHQTQQGVVFRQKITGARQVELAGDFNGWLPHSTPLRRVDDSGLFEATVPLQPGRYRYRLVVDGRWSPDAANPNTERNEFGETMSVVEVK